MRVTCLIATFLFSVAIATDANNSDMPIAAEKNSEMPAKLINAVPELEAVAPTPEDSDARARFENQLKSFASALNSFLTETHFDGAKFERKIKTLRNVIYDIDIALEKLPKYKVYPESLLRRFGRQFTTMVDACERMKRLNSGSLSDRLAYQMVELNVIASSLEYTHFVSLHDKAEYEARICRLYCSFTAAVDKYKTDAENVLPEEPSFWRYVDQTKRTVMALKRHVSSKSGWGKCPPN